MEVESGALSPYPGLLPASVCVCGCTQSLIHSLAHLSVLLADSTTSELELGLSAGGKRGL